jgi:hypothetical protein
MLPVPADFDRTHIMRSVTVVHAPDVQMNIAPSLFDVYQLLTGKCIHCAAGTIRSAAHRKVHGSAIDNLIVGLPVAWTAEIWFTVTSRRDELSV